MDLNEAERQLLAALREAEVEARPCGRAALEQRGERYWVFQEDWSAAFLNLRDRGLIAGEGNGFISANLISEAEQDFLPLIAGRLSRHLYHVRL